MVPSKGTVRENIRLVQDVQQRLLYLNLFPFLFGSIHVRCELNMSKGKSHELYLKLDGIDILAYSCRVWGSFFELSTSPQASGTLHFRFPNYKESQWRLPSAKGGCFKIWPQVQDGAVITKKLEQEGLNLQGDSWLVCGLWQPISLAYVAGF